MILTFPDKTKREFPSGVTPAEVAAIIGQGLKKVALAAKVNGRLVDLDTPIQSDADIKIITYEDDEGKEIFWHSTAHIMASAILHLYPKAKLAIGPAIPNDFSARFYYDIDLPQPLTEDDLGAIEAEMSKIIAKDLPFKRLEIPIEKAIKKFNDEGDIYKAEMVSEFESETVSLYTHGDFIDMCRGPHIPSTGKVKAFKLLSVAGSYWRGDENKKMLWRIYGVSFPEKKMLKEHLEKLEQAKLCDHRILGKALDLFSINDDIGPGLVLWHPKGAIVRNIIENFWREEHLKNGYELVYSPHIAKINLWHKSGHLDFYRDSMFDPMPVEGQQYQLKPMNCPFHIYIYKNKKRSYRDLPFRWAELGTVYRFERSGVLHGLSRVRGFTQDDAHVFCRPDQLEDELLKLLDFNLFFLKAFGFNEYETHLSTQPEKYVGSQEIWDKATEALKMALRKKELEYKMDPGAGVFYGPKIDVHIKDAFGRAWQCTTIQVDFNLPEKFGITYTGEDGSEHQTVMVHRALLGSIERFFGVLVEHYAGNFPVWLAPVQVKILLVVDEVNDYADRIADMFVSSGVRVEVDKRNQKIGYKIREAETLKIPYMLIVGKKEASEGKVSVRKHRIGDIGLTDPRSILAELLQKIKTRSID
ncbi:MAG: threonine--tRNA ligase [candidate division Zixibacteria bacterium 4484_95]|nr:MAG: threonine--tRNA ligase [candidate division Zixibacteria bacterium 4484_95]